MTKKKMNELVLEACAAHGASDELTAVLNDLTAPKAGGGTSVEDYTVIDADGVVTHIFCNLHKKWEPIEDEDGEQLFKVDPKAKNGYFRDCNVGVAQFREVDRSIKASKAAIMTDLLDEVITGADAKEAIAALGDTRSQITEREDGIGTEERPGDDEVAA